MHGIRNVARDEADVVGGGDLSRSDVARGRSPLAFFLLTSALLVPFYVLSAVINGQLIPGVPVGALGFVCLAASAVILSYRERGAAGAARLLARSGDVRRIRARAWLVPALVLAPAITVGTYALAIGEDHRLELPT